MSLEYIEITQNNEAESTITIGGDTNRLIATPRASNSPNSPSSSTRTDRFLNINFFKNLRNVFTSALVVVVAFAWHDTIKSSFDTYLREFITKENWSFGKVILPQLCYAFIVSAMLIYLTTK